MTRALTTLALALAMACGVAGCAARTSQADLRAWLCGYEAGVRDAELRRLWLADSLRVEVREMREANK